MQGLNGYFDNDLVRADLSEREQAEIESVIEGLDGRQRRLPRYKRRITSFRNRYRKRNTNHKKVMRVTKAPTTNLTAKAEFQARMHKLPKDVQADLLSGKLQIVDSSIYGTRLIGGQTSCEILHNADDKEVGRTNINARKLDKSMPFLCVGIILTSGVGAAGDNSISDIGNVSFTRMPAPMLNGEFSLEVGKKVLIPESPMEVFNTKNQSNVREGFFKLDNPKWIEPQTEIVFETKTPVPASAKTYIKVQLIGATLAKR